MKIIFWNIHCNKDQNPVAKLDAVAGLVDNRETDLLFLAECSEEMLAEIKKTYEEVIVPASSKIKCFKIGQAISCRCIKEIGPTRFVFFHVESGAIKCTLVVLHLPSKFHADVHRQHGISGKCILEINAYEQTVANTDTVLIGDFNMNPFDPGMVVFDGFNSVCSQDIAKKGKRIVDGENYNYFYNPSWKFFSGMDNETFKKTFYGTYYYHGCSGGHEFHWNNFDQVLLRPSMIRQYDHVFEILHDVAGFDLTKKNDISDHYPIFLELREKTHVRTA